MKVGERWKVDGDGDEKWMVEEVNKRHNNTSKDEIF